MIFECCNHVYYGDQLWVGFNHSRQLLGYTSLDEGMWLIHKNTDEFKKIQCKLVPCSQHELKAGETAYCSANPDDFDNLMNYMKVLSDGAKDFVWIEDEQSISVCEGFDDEDYIFYKVVQA